MRRVCVAMRHMVGWIWKLWHSFDRNANKCISASITDKHIKKKKKRGVGIVKILEKKGQMDAMWKAKYVDWYLYHISHRMAFIINGSIIMLMLMILMIMLCQPMIMLLMLVKTFLFHFTIFIVIQIEFYIFITDREKGSNGPSRWGFRHSVHSAYTLYQKNYQPSDFNPQPCFW